MKTSQRLTQALSKAQMGHIDEALALLEEAPDDEDNENVFGMIYFLLTAKQRIDDAIILAGQRIEKAHDDLGHSKWRLRRGLLYLQKEQKAEAQADFAVVMRLRANEDHVAQVGQAMAALLGQPNPTKKGGC